MNLINAWLKVAQQWHAYATHCAGQPMQVPVCRPFWTWVMTAAFVFSALTVLIVGWKIISYRMKLAAALRPDAARQYVDVGAIDARRWDGDKAYSTELGGEEVERRIREAMEKRRMDQAAGK
jgi:hypothetical protein